MDINRKGRPGSRFLPFGVCRAAYLSNKNFAAPFKYLTRIKQFMCSPLKFKEPRFETHNLFFKEKHFISRRKLAKYTVGTGAERRSIRASEQQRNKVFY